MSGGETGPRILSRPRVMIVRKQRFCFTQNRSVSLETVLFSSEGEAADARQQIATRFRTSARQLGDVPLPDQEGHGAGHCRL